jgi:hypothetical protein
VPLGRLREKNLQKGGSMERSERVWHTIGQVPVDTGRLALLDPSNVELLVGHEQDALDEMTCRVITNDYGVGVVALLSTGLGDGWYPIEARFEEAAGAARIAEIRVRFLPHPVVGYGFGVA